MALTKYQRDLITVVRASIDPNNPGFNGVQSVRDALQSAHLYLSTWVYPKLDTLLSGGPIRDRSSVAVDAARVRRAEREGRKT